jgi:hypothetical protein
MMLNVPSLAGLCNAKAASVGAVIQPLGINFFASLYW